MKNLILGATGTIGSGVVRELLDRNQDVRVLTRTAGKTDGFGAKVQTVVGNLLEPATLTGAFDGIDNVFLLNAVSTTETHEGLIALNEAKQAGVKRVVYLSVHNADQGAHIPHFGSKLPIETVLKSSGMQWTILRPNNFFQNDVWMKDAITKYGVYPQPIGDIGCSRVDARDIAEAAAIVMTTPGHEGQTYNLVGSKPINGTTAAEMWTTAMGTKISYQGNDLEAWSKQMAAYMPAFMLYDMKIMYAFFQKHGLLANETDIKRQTQMLGHAPRTFEAFVAETAKSWK